MSGRQDEINRRFDSIYNGNFSSLWHWKETFAGIEDGLLY